ncbi:hypothetical protein IEQ34_012299 [Dendrobium chrysotoxum]|uniref:Rhamnogalacturonase A/B/Epimerase-like pectate lyase domain-containing protein n=1 Tax=Dendrobium chrysotoxum TaxID=161865 RepID=A0AAV7GW66_DENCH|nr:hypothetical protein IEQ34_012299 [Dendrobium chrysotoxum]
MPLCLFTPNRFALFPEFQYLRIESASFYARELFVALLLVLVVADTIKGIQDVDGPCKFKRTVAPRPHSVTLTEFGAVGDGVTLNTIAFQNAIFYLRSFADKGGAQLYVPEGKWLTGSFNLISHLTLFLDKGAVIIGTQDLSQWPTAEPLPSYGRGIELPGRRYQSLINGNNLTDIAITGMGRDLIF